MAYVRLLRPEQWSKNVFVLAGIVFGRKLGDPHAILIAILGFACFCMLSSAVYIFNDIHDRAEDRLHPRKRKRPIAAGEVRVGAAALLAAFLLVASLVGALLVAPHMGFFIFAWAYLLLQLFYNLALKHIVILDVITLGVGFVLRAAAGAVLVDVVISHWLVLCTFTLCLFMGFSKRRCELNDLGNGASAGQHRPTLIEYTPELLNHMTTLTAGIAVVSFMLYATDQRTIAEFHSTYLIYTLPIVVYAIFRFALLVEHGRVDGPTAVLLHDRPFQAAIILWGLSAVTVVYASDALREWLSRALYGGGS